MGLWAVFIQLLDFAWWEEEQVTVAKPLHALDKDA